jgi:nucleoside-diphosphate-sugar epimerase
MTAKVLVAGASGVIGRRLGPLLTGARCRVFGTTRNEEAAAALQRSDITPILVDVFDANALLEAFAQIRPDIVIHQLTDLSGVFDPMRRTAALERNARIRREGTRNLVHAAVAAGARRLIAQSIAWMYAEGSEPHGEDDPLDLLAAGSRGISMAGVLALEESVLSARLEGIVLRYGHLYGPATGAGSPQDAAAPRVHVDAAANAALLALTQGQSGVYNIAEDCAYLTSRKAASELGWNPAFRVRS